ncbi:hypothetical protein [Streptomyces sp. NPDC093105]|uniref:hypothetical protein n=1 Tax=Streptomyces sp. NPDC093105 TaxID=3366029 RepID=UPI0037F79E12
MPEGLLEALPPGQHPPVRAELTLPGQAVEGAFEDPDRRAIAQQADVQGIGGVRRP